MPQPSEITIKLNPTLPLPYQYEARAFVNITDASRYHDDPHHTLRTVVGYGTSAKTALAALLTQLSDDDALPRLYHLALAKLRARRRIPIREAAATLGTSQAQLRRVERGESEMSPSDIAGWAQTLGISRADLRLEARRLIAAGQVG